MGGGILIYLMSDIHGHYQEFMEMLEKIKFSDSDTLFILGDVIDRGPLPIKLLLYVLQQNNIVLLMGNHEKMMVEGLTQSGSWGEHYNGLWLNNGGDTTLKEFKILPKGEQRSLLTKMKKLEYFRYVEMNGKKYLLSHSGVAMRDGDTIESALASDVETGRILWNREDILFWKNKSDVIMIHGHTPTWRWHPQLKPVIYAYEKGKKINIDCGCAQSLYLGCLCLDNKKKYYVKCKNIFGK